MKTKELREKAQKLNEESNALYRQANEIEKQELLPKYQYLKGKCFKIKDAYGEEKWFVYYLVKDVIDVSKWNKTLSVSMKCFSFDSRDGGVVFNLDTTEFHETLRALRAKEISRQEFDEALEVAYCKIQLASEPNS